MATIRATRKGYSVMLQGRRLFAGDFAACVAYCRARHISWQCTSPPG